MKTDKGGIAAFSLSLSLSLSLGCFINIELRVSPLSLVHRQSQDLYYLVNVAIF
ncbi:MAG: hypothetical protein KTM48_03005 [Wolbachia endosymbiont of Pissodes strobi]|nr:hypothetical protein [Wolbachia endosymbiont of Pissodes strobi]